MYTPALFTLRNRQCLCGRERYDMRFTSVKCGDERGCVSWCRGRVWSGQFSMHYERAPRFRSSKLDVAPPPLRCAGLRSATGAESNGSGLCGWERSAGGHRQIGWRMAFYLKRAIPALTYVAFFLFCARHCFRTLPESAPQFDAEIGKKRNAG